MSRISFENYGRLPRLLKDNIMLAGRYRVQRSAERNGLREVLGKLDLRPDDSLLDIGCNIGNFTIPLSFFVESTTGIDHPGCTEKLCHRFPKSIRLLPGNFLDLEVRDKFSKILCYAVLHYLTDRDEVLRFVDKAVAMLTPGGRALFGDLPNISLKERFLSSQRGRKFFKEWEQHRQSASSGQEFDALIEPDPALVQFDDALLMGMLMRYRQKGYQAYLLPQDPELPFGHTREDLVIESPS